MVLKKMLDSLAEVQGFQVLKDLENIMQSLGVEGQHPVRSVAVDLFVPLFEFLHQVMEH